MTAADASAAAGGTGIGRRRRPVNLLLAHPSEVRKEIHPLVGGAAEVRSQIHDDRIRCPVLRVRTKGRRHHGARVRRVWAHRVVPRRDRTTVLSGEPRSRSGSCVRLPDPCRQHGPAIRGAHVRARSTQPNVTPAHCALPGYPARSMLVVDSAHSHEVWVKGRLAGSLVPALRPAHGGSSAAAPVLALVSLRARPVPHRLVRGVPRHPDAGDLRDPHPARPVLPQPSQHPAGARRARCRRGRGRAALHAARPRAGFPAAPG